MGERGENGVSHRFIMGKSLGKRHVETSEKLVTLNLR